LKSRQSEKYLLATSADRFWHWIHAVGILLLIVSGFSIHFSKYLGEFIAFDMAVKIHNLVGIIVAYDWGLWLIYNVFSKRMSYYIPNHDDLPSGMIKQTKYYLHGIFRKVSPPFPVRPSRKFNPLQKWTYLGVMIILVPFEIITGLYMLLLIKGWSNFIDSNVKLISILHTIGAFGTTAFLIGHIYLATTGDKPYSHFIMMITGYHEHE
jgi:thiosulfate reductase cytochrome b subunit